MLGQADIEMHSKISAMRTHHGIGRPRLASMGLSTRQASWNNLVGIGLRLQTGNAELVAGVLAPFAEKAKAMSQADEYLQIANECTSWARTSTCAAQRKQLLEAARTWRTVAALMHHRVDRRSHEYAPRPFRRVYH